MFSTQADVLNGDLNVSDNSGFHMVTTLKGNIKQNLKMLILTNRVIVTGKHIITSK
jgi:hypothetical protein